MRTETIVRGAHTITEYRPQAKNSMVKPSILKQFFQGRGAQRTRMYKTTDGRTFIADTFDRIFKPAITLTIKPKHFKAKSLDSRVIY